ncbi:hypothetical protein M427DRAFT_438109 [Gonapodya prolifera JEL478]|uniref:Uncharacterized protein n=1 Tax=Gonapodya prolifera (strain JEL478) TaxID=1344416 RepID=A0A139A4L7_GONPJ|nr:hypothetical protein M427DRAFT_438109 [Gonapodya prolifera JEL478]|eukprot:KXS11313.1 hypothetical protein M427DRAFT_438109 [Gonapodya prolifera JEL478]
MSHNWKRVVDTYRKHGSRLPYISPHTTTQRPLWKWRILNEARNDKEGPLWPWRHGATHPNSVHPTPPTPSTPFEYFLLLAAKRGNVEMARSLLDVGTNPNARDISHATPLHIAALYSHPHLVSLLLRNGADPLARDSRGRTSIDIATDVVLGVVRPRDVDGGGGGGGGGVGRESAKDGHRERERERAGEVYGILATWRAARKVEVESSEDASCGAGAEAGEGLKSVKDRAREAAKMEPEGGSVQFRPVDSHTEDIHAQSSANVQSVGISAQFRPVDSQNETIHAQEAANMETAGGGVKFRPVDPPTENVQIQANTVQDHAPTLPPRIAKPQVQLEETGTATGTGTGTVAEASPTAERQNPASHDGFTQAEPGLHVLTPAPAPPYRDAQKNASATASGTAAATATATTTTTTTAKADPNAVPTPTPTPTLLDATTTIVAPISEMIESLVSSLWPATSEGVEKRQENRSAPQHHHYQPPTTTSVGTGTALTDLQRAAATAATRLADMEAELAAAVRAQSDVLDQKRVLEERLQAVEAERDAVIARAETLQAAAQVQNDDAEVARARADLDEATRVVRELEARLAQEKKEWEEKLLVLEVRFEREVRARIAAEEEVVRAREEVERMREQLAVVEARWEQAQGVMSALDGVKSDFSAQLDRARAEVEKAREDSSATQAAYAQLKRDAEDFEHVVSKLRKQVRVQGEQMEEMEGRNGELRVRLLRSSEHRKVLAETVRDESRKVENATRKAEALELQVEALTKRNHELAAERHVYVAQTGVERQRADEAVLELNDLKMQLGERRERHEAAEKGASAEIAHLKTLNDELLNRLADVEARVQPLHQQLDNAQIEAVGLKAIISFLRQKVRSVEEQAQARLNQETDLTRQIMSMLRGTKRKAEDEQTKKTKPEDDLVLNGNYEAMQPKELHNLRTLTSGRNLMIKAGRDGSVHFLRCSTTLRRPHTGPLPLRQTRLVRWRSCLRTPLLR